jgi:hypothetical protein
MLFTCAYSPFPMPLSFAAASTGQGDAVIIARELLRDPYWTLRAACELGQPISWAVQYLRAAPEGSQTRVAVDLKNLESCFEDTRFLSADPRPTPETDHLKQG